VVAAGTEAEAVVVEALAALGLQPKPWPELRAAILAAASPAASPAPSPPAPAVAVVAIAGPAEPPAEWRFDAGLAIGALGPAAIVVEVGSPAARSAIEGLDTVALSAGGPGLPELAERLRRVGIPVAAPA
jgi:hypothetical protein